MCSECADPVAGEPNVAQFPRRSRIDERGVGAFLVEDPMRVLVPNHLVVLHEVDAIGTQTAE
jgi:hypothetical protein